MNQIKKIIFTYRLYSGALAVMLFLLLLRIPFGTFNEYSFVDTIAHFILPAAGAPLLAVFVERTGLLRTTGRGAFIFLSSLLGIVAEVLWEVFEYWVDTLFQLDWQPSNPDTMVDIMLAIAGAILGSLLFKALYRSPN